METISSILPTFVGKIEDAVSMVAAMPAEEKLKAVQYWNAVSEKLQEIVNDSAADISALAFKGEKAEFISPAHLGLSVGTQQHLLTAPTVMGMVAQNVGIISARNRGRRLRSGIQDENGSREALMSFLATLPTQPPGTTDVAIATDPVVEEIAIAAQNPVIDDAEKDKEENEDGNVDEDDDDDDVDNDGPDEVDDDDLTGKSFVDFSAAVAELGVQHDITSELKATDSATLHLMISADPSTTHEASEVQKKRRKKTKSGEEVEEVYYECEYCKKTFGTPSQLTAHRWTHTKPYICLDCKARFSTRGNLMVHRRRHTGEKPYPCDKCDAKFSTKGNLKRHIKAHSGEKPWECTQCGGRFTEKKSLKVHMRRHTGEKPYQCKVCFKRFAQSGILQTHMAMHLNQKTHLCELCGKSFRQRSQLRLHTQRHAGVRKFDCDICPAKFLTKGDMERHRRTHTGERPFVCELCGKPFTRQQSLNEHMNRHYGLKPYECKYCGKGFAEMSACYKHIKSHERSAKDDMTEQLVNSIRNQVQDSQCASSQEPAKYTVLLHADQSLDVGREMVVTGVANSSLPEETQQVTVTVSEDIQEFAAINLLASASTFQQAF